MKTQKQVETYVSQFNWMKSELDKLTGYVIAKGLDIFSFVTDDESPYCSFEEFKEWFEKDITRCNKCNNTPHTTTEKEAFKPKKGDICYAEGVLKGIRIFIYGCNVSIHNSEGDECIWSAGSVRLATDDEKYILFSALKESGEFWNEETLELENLELLASSNISLFKCNDTMAIGFNNDKQCLHYSPTQGIYEVTSPKFSYKKVCCNLYECDIKDLNNGDIVFVVKKNSLNIDYDITLECNYFLFYDNKYFVHANSKGEISISDFSRLDVSYYKVTPIDND